MVTDDDLKEFFKGQGYEQVEKTDHWGWCGINRYIFTYGVLYNMNQWSVGGRFCFDTKGNALAFYKDLIKDGKAVELPVVGIDGCTAIK